MTFNPLPLQSGGSSQPHGDVPHSNIAKHAHVAATNGRVAIDDRKARQAYSLYAPDPNEGGGRTISHLGSVQTETTLSRAYFSKANQQILQNAIRSNVHKSTGEVIGEQDSVQLQIIMRSIFLQNARHSESVPISEQVATLNRLVLEYALHEVISNVKQHLQYKKDISRLPEPFDHAVNVSQKGSKTLSVHPFV